MPEWFNWVFDGIGTEIIIGLVGLVVGGIGGFAIGRRTKSTQTQKAKESARQKQTFSVDNGNPPKTKSYKSKNSVVQKQEAENNAEQIQIGNVKHGR